MNDVIRLLPDSVANQIAAGEVIQQPASVVKELVENAVDAGAKHITIVIKDAGRTLIQVVDDGSGMSETDARLAFERHATSKITAAADLFALHTMGFRGEALASICAVAQVELRTRREDDAVGTRLEISGSKVTAQEPCGCATGSNMSVKNLFFNVPARRKFLKKDSVEFSNIVKEFERLALVNPEIDLTLVHNDITIHRLVKASFKQRILDLFGKSLSTQLIPIQTETSMVKIQGYIGLPENARRKGALQFMTVNGRNMRHPVFHKAIMQCYENLIHHEAKPNFFIDFIVDPDTIDVNIHPTKNEIKFENEMAIRQILVAAIRESMGKYNVVPAIDFESVDVPDIPVFQPDENANHSVDIDVNYNPFATSSSVHTNNVSAGVHIESRANQVRGSRMNTSSHSTLGWEALYDNFKRSSADYEQEGLRGSALNMEESSDATGALLAGMEKTDTTVPGAFQLKGRYIVTTSHDGLMVIDQHRAHLNILYNKYIQEVKSDSIASQTLLFPERLELSPAQASVVDSLMVELRATGFEISELPDGSRQVIAVPAIIKESNISESIIGLIDEVMETDADGPENLHSAIAMGMARAMAIRPGQSLNLKEIEHILAQLFSLSSPALLPDGRKVLTVINTESIADMLG